MKALVTGAAGFIGSHLCAALRDRGWNVSGIDSFTDYYDPAIKRARAARLGASIPILEADIAQVDLAPLLDGVDAVFHLAAQAGVRASWGDDFRLYLDRNLLATQKLLEEMKSLRDSRSRDIRMVFASSSSVYGDAETLPTIETAERKPVSPYGMTKSACEDLLRIYGKAHGLKWIALRYFTVYGPGQRPDMAFHKLIRAAIDGREFMVYGDGSQERDVTFVSDIVDATIAAATCEASGETINIGRGEMVALRQVLEHVAATASPRFKLVYSAFQTGDARATGASIEKARRLLGYAPKVSWREGIERQMEAMRNE